MRFIKMEGLGNDFVVIDARQKTARTTLTTAKIKWLCNRNFGIGADQLLAISKSIKADAKMRIFNPDGSEAEMCGNGARCVALYLSKNKSQNSGTAKKQKHKNTINIETKAGIIKTEILGNNQVCVDMDVPKYNIVNRKLQIANRKFIGWQISMGNPHYVIFVKDVKKAPVTTLGPLIEKHPSFPNRINVEFVQVINLRRLKVRVWERGAGETLACGSGACASVVAGNIAGKIDEEAAIIVDLAGGALKIVWQRQGNNHVYMAGPAAFVFNGKIMF